MLQVQQQEQVGSSETLVENQPCNVSFQITITEFSWKVQWKNISILTILVTVVEETSIFKQWIEESSGKEGMKSSSLKKVLFWFVC